MIELLTAIRLKQAGLAWSPKRHDFFAIPATDLEELIFVISDIQATVENLQGLQIISFQGASEWALDSLILADAVWIPSSAQLHEIMISLLEKRNSSGYSLVYDGQEYKLSFQEARYSHPFIDVTLDELYAKVILLLLAA